MERKKLTQMKINEACISRSWDVFIGEKKLITNSKCQNGNVNITFVPYLALSNSVKWRVGKGNAL